MEGAFAFPAAVRVSSVQCRGSRGTDVVHVGTHKTLTPSTICRAAYRCLRAGASYLMVRAECGEKMPKPSVEQSELCVPTHCLAKPESHYMFFSSLEQTYQAALVAHFHITAKIDLYAHSSLYSLPIVSNTYLPTRSDTCEINMVIRFHGVSVQWYSY